jgi:hypothetical protein
MRSEMIAAMGTPIPRVTPPTSWAVRAIELGRWTTFVAYCSRKVVVMKKAVVMRRRRAGPPSAPAGPHQAKTAQSCDQLLWSGLNCGHRRFYGVGGED